MAAKDTHVGVCKEENSRAREELMKDDNDIKVFYYPASC